MSDAIGLTTQTRHDADGVGVVRIVTLPPRSTLTATDHSPQPLDTTMTTDLFQPFQLGPLALPNRIVMAPMTRSRSAQPGACLMR